MKVVITGATSMLGVAVIKACIQKNDRVLAVVREDTKRLDRLPKSELIEVKYANLDQLSKMQRPESEYDVFYHFAWEHTAREERDDPIAQEDNIRTALQAVKLAARLGCRKFIGAGSQAEYGQVEGVISADTRPNPITAYGMSKYATGILCKRLCEQLGMVYIWGRIFSVYGCLDNEGTMLNYAIGQFEKGQSAEFSSAMQMWNYLNEEDAGEMFRLLGEKDIESGIYCIANEESRILRDYIEELKDIYGEGAECTFAPIDDMKKPVGIQADIEKTVLAIKYHPQISFETGIKKMIEARREQR